MAQVKLKMVGADWFEQLPALTRVTFLTGLVADNLQGSVHRQAELLRSPACLALPGPQQATVLRRVAAAYLRQGSELPFVQTCLRQALRVCPGDWRSRLMLSVSLLGPRAGRAVFAVWPALRDLGRTQCEGAWRRRCRLALAHRKAEVD